MADELMWTIGDQGQLSDVAVKDWEKWLATTRKSNPDIRPPGTGPNGEWTVEDEQAAVDLYDENKEYGEEREIWDILADEAGITGPPKAVLDEPAQRATLPEYLKEGEYEPIEPMEPMEFDREALDAANEWSVETAKKGAMDPQVSKGLIKLLPTPETFGALANGAAKEAIGQSPTKPYSRDPEYWTYKGFGEWEPTQKWHDEQFTGPLTDEQRLPIGRGGVADASDEALKRKNQKSVDNPFGKK